MDLATRFQNLTLLALKAHYGGDAVFDHSPSLKLATLIVNRNELFSKDVSLRGHVIRFGESPKRSDSIEESEDDGDSQSLQKEGFANLLSNTKPSTANRYAQDFGELDDLLQAGGGVVMPLSTNIMKWLEDIYKGSRGFELGTFDSSIIPIIWKKQSANWDDLALGYISDVVSLVHGFNVDLLRSCCSDERVLVGLESVLSDHLIQRYNKAIQHVKFLLRTEREGTPLTANHYFADNLEKW